jgi:hypothetical protein
MPGKKGTKQQPNPPKRGDSREGLSLHGLTLEEALEAVMKTGPHPKQRIDGDPATKTKVKRRG